MQADQMQQRIDHIAQHISDATRLCESNPSLPQELKRSVSELDKRSKAAQQLLLTAEDEEVILDCIDELEELGDRAKRACEKAPNVDEELSTSILIAHDELSELKHELH
ncbi:MAG TPA: hypothetical protein VJM53_00085 [Burkholderiales bacterium]|jgi:uncharacterized coiled-coil DUF342 family protein|nr:hypothetical protein [Burkholderiales bacterium]